MAKIDWSALWKKEDWWACWIGWLLILLGIGAMLPKAPSIATWTVLSKALPQGWGTLGPLVSLFILIAIVTGIGAAVMKRGFLQYFPGFLVIYVIAFVAMIIAGQKGIKYYGFEYVLWALFIGLLISNIFGVPAWLKPAVMTEFFVKIGLVIMGATINFAVVIKAGGVAMLQAVLVVAVVWFFSYWLSRRFGINQRFSSVLATGVSICGVSASIAAGGAVQGDPKETSYILAWLMIGAVICIVVMPPIGKWMGLPGNMAGAWLGGVIDNTGAVVAAGEVFGGKPALDAAALVKMAQNILIGFAAFLLALWATLGLEKKETGEKPSLAEVWYRFPKFIVGFVLASIFITFFVPAATSKAVEGLFGAYRNWFFAFCFVCIGLDTRLKDLISVGGGKPAIVYWIAQAFNAVWTLIIVWILWSGWLFPPPIPPN